MQIDTLNKFQSFLLSEEEDKQASTVSPLFHAFLKNKIAEYASAVIDVRRDSFKTVDEYLLHLEVLKGQVTVLEELLDELALPSAGESNPL